MDVGKGSKLPLEVQRLIQMIFDVESMKKTMAEFEVTLISLICSVIFVITSLSSLWLSSLRPEKIYGIK